MLFWHTFLCICTKRWFVLFLVSSKSPKSNQISKQQQCLLKYLTSLSFKVNVIWQCFYMADIFHLKCRHFVPIVSLCFDCFTFFQLFDFVYLMNKCFVKFALQLVKALISWHSLSAWYFDYCSLLSKHHRWVRR